MCDWTGLNAVRHIYTWDKTDDEIEDIVVHHLSEGSKVRVYQDVIEIEERSNDARS